MPVNNPSLPGAFALVGIGLVTLSVAIVLAGLGGVAHAGDGSAAASPRDDRSERASLSKPTASEGKAPGIQDEGGQDAALMASGSGCVEADPLDWFGEIRELPRCESVTFGVPTQDSSAADVNGDGSVENFTFVGQILQDGAPIPAECAFAMFEPRSEGHSLIFEERCLVTVERLAGWLLGRAGAISNASVFFGWIDLDRDGDQDLVATFYSGDVNPPISAWLENTGYEDTQPLTGDLNSDGNVNSADLALLLGGWTGG